MLTGHAQRIVRRHLQGVGYDSSLIGENWTPLDVESGEPLAHVPLMAFWAEPFDQFRSAIAVMPKNGIPPSELAQRTVSHVLMCEEDAVELWLLHADDLKRESHVPLAQLEGLFAAYRGQLERNKVAKTKIRLRQYALYEADPKGEAHGQWAIKPSIDQASSQLGRLIAATKPSSKGTKASIKPDLWARWLFRVLTLRVGLDRDWSVASGLDREDVSDFSIRASEYPMRWDHISLPDQFRIEITERTLRDLQPFDFSTVDPLIVSKAVAAASLKRIRSDIDLFPTPRPFAWDMMDSIPLTAEAGICDATAGTGTFLVAAGHSIWADAVGTTADLPDLRQSLRGADLSALSTDIAHMALDLAFDYREDAKWAVERMEAKKALHKLPLNRDWFLVGNPPWNARGSSRNKASEILSNYVDVLMKRKYGWIAIVLPRTVLTSQHLRDKKMHDKIAANFQLESAWELPFGSIPGGRSQATAIVLSRGQAKTTTVWKQLDNDGAVKTVGYGGSVRSQDFFLSAHGRFIESKLANLTRLADWFDVKRGVELKSAGTLVAPPRRGAIPYVHLPSQLRLRRESLLEKLEKRGVPESLTFKDAVKKGGWIEENYFRPARAYRGALKMLPQVVIPRTVYEGVRRLCPSVAVVESPALFSEEFCILIPKGEVSESLARGVATVVTSLFGRLWIHLHALAGRHISVDRLSNFPLLSVEEMERLSYSVGIDSHEYTPKPIQAQLFGHREDYEKELRVFSMYGFDKRESAALLSLSYFLGHTPSDPQILRQQMADMQKSPGRVKELLDLMGTTGDANKRSQLYVEALAEEQKDDYLVVGGRECQLSIRKSSIGSANG